MHGVYDLVGRRFAVGRGAERAGLPGTDRTALPGEMYPAGPGIRRPVLSCPVRRHCLAGPPSPERCTQPHLKSGGLSCSVLSTQCLPTALPREVYPAAPDVRGPVLSCLVRRQCLDGPPSPEGCTQPGLASVALSCPPLNASKLIQIGVS